MLAPDRRVQLERNSHYSLVRLLPPPPTPTGHRPPPPTPSQKINKYGDLRFVPRVTILSWNPEKNMVYEGLAVFYIGLTSSCCTGLPISGFQFPLLLIEYKTTRS
jgi:hypothetical protein